MSPRRNRKARGPAPPALFTWGPHAADIQPDQARDNPRARPCPTCKALAREPCTRAGRGGRVPLDGYHPSRKTPTKDDQNTSGNPPSAPTGARNEPRQ